MLFKFQQAFQRLQNLEPVTLGYLSCTHEGYWQFMTTIRPLRIKCLFELTRPTGKFKASNIAEFTTSIYTDPDI